MKIGDTVRVKNEPSAATGEIRVVHDNGSVMLEDRLLGFQWWNRAELEVVSLPGDRTP